MWRRQCSSLVSSARTSLNAMPALFTRMAASSRRAGERLDRRAVGDVERRAVGLDAQRAQLAHRVGHPLGQLLGDMHARAGLAECLRAGEADALAAAGDHRDATIEPELLQIHGGAFRYLTAPNVRPRTSCRWLIQPNTRIGAIASTEAADSLAQNSPCGAENEAMKAGQRRAVVRR